MNIKQLTQKRKRVLQLSKEILSADRVLVKESYPKVKEELERLLRSFNSNVARTAKDGLYITNQVELNTLHDSIIENINKLNNLYREMKETKKPFFKKLKGGEVVDLLQRENKYIKGLEKTRIKCKAILEMYGKKAADIEIRKETSKLIKQLNFLILVDETILNGIREGLQKDDTRQDVVAALQDKLDSIRSEEEFTNAHKEVVEFQEKIMFENLQDASVLDSRRGSLKSIIESMLEHKNVMFQAEIKKLDDIKFELEKYDPMSIHFGDPVSCIKLNTLDQELKKFESQAIGFDNLINIGLIKRVLDKEIAYLEKDSNHDGHALTALEEAKKEINTINEKINKYNSTEDCRLDIQAIKTRVIPFIIETVSDRLNKFNTAVHNKPDVKREDFFTIYDPKTKTIKKDYLNFITNKNPASLELLKIFNEIKSLVEKPHHLLSSTRNLFFDRSSSKNPKDKRSVDHTNPRESTSNSHKK